MSLKSEKQGSKALNTFDQLKQLIQSRDQTKRLLGSLLFGLPIIVVFIFFGLPSDRLSGGGSNAAQVNGTFISLQDFSQEEQRIQKMQEYYAQMFGQPVTFDPQRQKAMRQQAAESLIQMELLSQATEQEKILVSDKEILAYIQDMNEFKQDGVFQASLYFQLLEANRLTPANFENKIRKQIQTIRTRQLFEASVKPSKFELNKLSELSKEQWNIRFVKINKEELVGKVKIDESEVKKSLSSDDFQKRVKSFFEANQSKYNESERVSAQVIVVNFTPGNGDSEKKAHDKIIEIEKMTQTQDFGLLAQKMSDDAGTKSKKGEMGYFARGEKDPAVEQAAFSLEKGKISAPVKGFSSYQLIKLLDRKESKKADLELVKNKIASELLGKDKIEEIEKTLEGALKNQNISLVEELVKKTGANWEDTGLFSLDSMQIPKLTEKDLQLAAFEMNPISKKMVPRLVSVHGAHYVLSLKETKKLESSKTNDSKYLVQQTASQLQDDWIKQYRLSSKVKINPLILQ